MCVWYELLISGVASDCRGLVQYEDLLTLLTCLQCRCLISPPVAQCRKGHLYCLSCKWALLKDISTNYFLKTGKEISWAAARSASRPLWTRRTRRWRRWSGWLGCPASTATEAAQSSYFFQAGSSMKHSAGSAFTYSRHDFEMFRFRPTECQFQRHGCDEVYSYKVRRGKSCIFIQKWWERIIWVLPVTQMSNIRGRVVYLHKVSYWNVTRDTFAGSANFERIW